MFFRSLLGAGGTVALIAGTCPQEHCAADDEKQRPEGLEHAVHELLVAERGRQDDPGQHAFSGRVAEEPAQLGRGPNQVAE